MNMAVAKPNKNQIPTSETAVSVTSTGAGRLDASGTASVTSTNIQDPQAQPDTNLDKATETRRRRWTLLLRKREDAPQGKVKLKDISFTCQCKSAVKGSCLILFSSFIELLGCMICLVCGIAYIEDAINFYKLDSDPSKQAREYEDKLQRVLFLQENRVGFVGLLATCLVGVFISFLMPIGTIYRSWKCLRVAMSLLFSVSLAHVILISAFLSRNKLSWSVIAIPYRVYEFYLLSSYIKYYKKKKFEELKEQMRTTCNAQVVDPNYSDIILDSGSICSFDCPKTNNNVVGTPQVEKTGSINDIKITLDQIPVAVSTTASQGEIDKTDQDQEKPAKRTRKRRALLGAWIGDQTVPRTNTSPEKILQ